MYICESFIPDFGNILYLLQLNELEDDASEGKELENDISAKTCVVNKKFLDIKLNVNDNAAKMLDNRLQRNFVCKNVVNMSRQNLIVSEIFLLSKGIYFVPNSNTIVKVNPKTELEAFDRIARLS